MIIAVITALLCFVAAIIMLSPYFRKIPLLHPMAVYLIFVGAMQIISYLVNDLYPTSLVPAYIFRIGTIVIIVYYLFIMLMTHTKSRRKNGKKTKEKKKKKN